jgi:hypothetical protein
LRRVVDLRRIVALQNRSSTSVRAPGRVVRRGRCGVHRWRGPRRLLRFTRPIARTDKTPSSPRRAQRRLSVALRPRVAARSAMSGASLRRRRRRPDEGGGETLVPATGQCDVADCHKVGSRTDYALFAPPRSLPPSDAMRPRAAARSPMRGAVVAGDEGGRVRTRNAHPAPSGSPGSADCHTNNSSSAGAVDSMARISKFLRNRE